MIVLIMLGSIINYLTRSTLAVAAPTVLKDLHVAGTRRPADFDYFEYRERSYRAEPRRVAAV
jgi:hypothetical protein